MTTRKKSSLVSFAGELHRELMIDRRCSESGKTIDRWNVSAQRAMRISTPACTMMPIATPPFWSKVTDGIEYARWSGPQCRQQVMDTNDQPIPGCTQQELGSVWSSLLSGGNVAECFVTGRIGWKHPVSVADQAATAQLAEPGADAMGSLPRNDGTDIHGGASGVR
jgi:hypothetical protein